jgi:transposase
MQLGRARALLAQGITKRQVAAELGVGVATLLRHLADDDPKTSQGSASETTGSSAAE